MRNMKLHTICTVVMATSIFTAFNAASGTVSFDPNMEAQAGCANINCMVPVEPTIASPQALELRQFGGEAARLIKVNVFKESTITTVPRARLPQFNGIGIVRRVSDVQKVSASTNPQVPYANGINIGPCTVVTNLHVQAELGSDRTQSMRFNVGYSKDSAFADASVITPVLTGDLRTRDYSINNDPSCMGAKHGYYKPSNQTKYDLVREKAKVMVVWFDPQGNMSVSSGHVTGIDNDNGNVMFDASTKPGSSAGAIFVVDNETGELRLQGINGGAIGSDYNHYSFDSYADSRANEFISIEDVLGGPSVRQRVAADVTSHAGTNPIEQYLKLRK